LDASQFGATLCTLKLSYRKSKQVFKVLFFLLAILVVGSAVGQSKKSIEFSVIGRYDRHANYVSNFAGRAYNDTNKLYGTSYGANITYRKNINHNFSVSMGIGYYRLNVDRIKGSMPFNSPGTRTSRSIDYDDGSTNLLYSTSKYRYNNLVVTAAVNKMVPVTDRWFLDLGAEAIGYYSLSQSYQLFDGPDRYTTHNAKPFEFGANLTLGFLKEYDLFYFRPALMLPVYQHLKGDRVFYENRNMNISKWFNGAGLILRIGKYF
jgi:hypothetical protein